MTNQTQICTTLTATTIKDALEQMRQAADSGADLAELRLDLIQGPFDAEKDIKQLVSSGSPPLLVSCWPASLGGKFSGSEEQRLAVLRSAAQQGVQYVDIDVDAAKDFISGDAPMPKGTSLMVSHYDPEATPDDETLRQIVQRLRGAGGSVARIVTTAQDIADAFRVLALLRGKDDSQVPLVALAQGERGLPTRILAPIYGAVMTFGALQRGTPGEPSVEQLKKEYRLANMTTDTMIFGIAGSNVAPDRNYIAHNATHEALGVNGVYMPYLVDDFASFKRAAGEHRLTGYSVTMPHKGKALAAAEVKDQIAQDIGASNTMVRQPDGGYKALNTDWVGVKVALERAYGGSAGSTDEKLMAGKKALVVGTGGAGQAVAYYCARAGAQVLVADVMTEKAEQLAASLGSSVSVVSMDDVNAGRVPVDVLANASPIGMSPLVDDMAVTTAAIEQAQLCFDAIYTPPKTKFLKTAEGMGKQIVSGFDMFVYQANYQYQLFTGREDDVADLMREAVLPTL